MVYIAPANQYMTERSHREHKKKGATFQATYFDPDRKVVCHGVNAAETAVIVSGRDILTNAQVNVASILVASAAGGVLGPCVFR
jgi:hypothetical protein